ncbi:Leucine-rich repeat-containing 33 [Gossypium australe]|uniref:Leucine-rich repeat-containing 33 n=1 Tax=Gossypium australe TaxID=47621 RepID=A0A5B6VA15_9ROSI|nr:Leucine-rich repeat-containing 33 [Gossypium australe]
MGEGHGRVSGCVDKSVCMPCFSTAWTHGRVQGRVRHTAYPHGHPDRVVADDVESNAPAPTQGIALAESRPIASSHEGEAKQALFQIMSECFSSSFEQIWLLKNLHPHNKPPVDKIRKYGTEEFRATVDDDTERAEFWFENTI